MPTPKDPTGDLFAIMDKAKLNGGNFLQSTVGMSKLVMETRTILAADLKAYIERREQEAYEKGFKEGRNNEI